MSRILFVTFDGGGNQRPARSIARALATRGHTVAFLGHESQRGHIEADDFAFTSYPSSPAWDGTVALAAAERRMRLIRNVFLDSHMVTDVLAVLEHQPADLLVVDCLLFSAMGSALPLILWLPCVGRRSLDQPPEPVACGSRASRASLSDGFVGRLPAGVGCVAR
jgi:UDP:flavonoid glycosyltransferase YjiC (YdhE family)